MPVIDADAHVVETERTWDFMDPSEACFRPTLAAPADAPDDLRWLVDDKLRRRALLSRSSESLPRGRNTATPAEAREMADLDARLRHMDELGIDVQVLHNTLFIEQVADRPEVELAVCKGWNRWLADIWKRGEGRFRWSCVLPLMRMNDALDELRFAKEHGAVAVCLRPIEASQTLPDVYFYPIYEEASRLDMAIAVHIANGNVDICAALRSPYDPGSGFGVFRAMTAVSCHSYMSSDLPKRFPDLRWGFIEASAQWAPWVAHEAARRHEATGRPFPENPFREFRVYVTCQTDDDLPYIIGYTGEDNLVIGTDYGHFDPSSEVDAFEILRARSDLSPRVIEKIMDDNPRALYGL